MRPRQPKILKECCICGVEFLETNWKSFTCSDECRLERKRECAREWKAANPEQAKANKRAWVRENPERVSAAYDRWRRSHLPQVRAYQREWYHRGRKLTSQ